MTKYAYEAGEIVEYTPDSLANIASPCVFRLRPATERDRRTIRKLIHKNRLVRHSAPDMREEMINGLREMWSEDTLLAYEGRLRSYWDATDQYEQEFSGAENPPPFEHPDQKAMDELSNRVFKVWDPLASMIADNAEFDDVWPKLIASVVIAGWSGIDASYGREDGVVTMECLDAVRAALVKVEEKAMEDKVEGVIAPGIAFMQLVTRAIGMFSLGKDEEKNSSSPSLSAKTPPTSKKVGKEVEAGSSMASSSTETLAT